MAESELRRAITKPAHRMGLHVEAGLVDAIIGEAGSETGSLPLVAHALVETWLRRKGNTLTLEGFRAAGGVAGAISQTAEAIFKDRFDAGEIPHRFSGAYHAFPSMDGQVDIEGGPMPLATLHDDITAVIGHDAVDDGEP